MASSGAVLSIGRRMCFRPEASVPASSGRWRLGAMSRFHDTIEAANGEQQLGGVEDGIPHVRVSRHWIWPSAICTFVQIKWSCQQEVVGSQKPVGVPKSNICKGKSSNLLLRL